MKCIFKLLLVLLLLTGSLFAQENLTIPPYDNRLDKYPNTMMWYNTADKLTESAYNIALTYDMRIKDYKLAKLWYKQALVLDAKNTDAANNLGYLYDYIDNNNKKAIEFYIKAIEGQNLISMKNLSLLYYKKLHNTVKAVEYFIPLIDNRYPKAKVLKFFKVKYHADDKTIKKGYEAQLKSTIIPEKLKYKGGI